MPLLTAAYIPASGSDIHVTVRCAWNLRRRSNVPSVDPPSTTMCSIRPYDWHLTDSSVAPRRCARLSVGVMIDPSAMALNAVFTRAVAIVEERTNKALAGGGASSS